MERIYFYETLYEKALECANSGDLSDYYDILYDFFIDNEETIASSVLRNSLSPKGKMLMKPDRHCYRLMQED